MPTEKPKSSGKRTTTGKWLPCPRSVTSAAEDVELWRGRIDGAQQELDRVSAIVHDRNSRALRVNDIENLCVKAVRDGASAGVAQNLGIVRGLELPPQPVRPAQLSREIK